MSHLKKNKKVPFFAMLFLAICKLLVLIMFKDSTKAINWGLGSTWFCLIGFGYGWDTFMPMAYGAWDFNNGRNDEDRTIVTIISLFLFVLFFVFYW